MAYLEDKTNLKQDSALGIPLEAWVQVHLMHPQALLVVSLVQNQLGLVQRLPLELQLVQACLVTQGHLEQQQYLAQGH